MSLSPDEEIDPFEARIIFTRLLDRLTASHMPLTKACQFAVKYVLFAENLYACFIEELEQVFLALIFHCDFYSKPSFLCAAIHFSNNKASINTRLNLMILMDCIMQKTSDYTPFVSVDLEKIVQSVVPHDSNGIVNKASAFKVFFCLFLIFIYLQV